MHSSAPRKDSLNDTLQAGFSVKTSPAPATTKPNSCAAWSLSREKEIFVGEILSSWELERVMSEMYEVKSVEIVWTRDEEELRKTKFEESRCMYVVEGERVGAEVEKVVLWRGRIVRLGVGGNLQAMKASGLGSECRIMGGGVGLMIGNCEVMLSLPRLKVSRSNKRCMLVGDV